MTKLNVTYSTIGFDHLCFSHAIQMSLFSNSRVHAEADTDVLNKALAAHCDVCSRVSATDNPTTYDRLRDLFTKHILQLIRDRIGV